jgi:hypothetical protein
MKFVGELVARPTTACPFGASTLDHEVRNHAMKNKAIIKRLAGLDALSEIEKIFHCLGHPVGKQSCLERSFRGIENCKDIIGHEGDSNSTGDGAANENRECREITNRWEPASPGTRGCTTLSAENLLEVEKLLLSGTGFSNQMQLRVQ